MSDNQVSALREEMNARLLAMQGWMERITTAVETFNKDGRKLDALEARFEGEVKAINTSIASIKSSVDELKITIAGITKAETKQAITLSGLVTFKNALGVAAAGAIAALFNHLPWWNH